MVVTRYSLVVLIALIAVVINVCVGGQKPEDKPVPPSAIKPRTTVLVMRHCFRSTSESGILDVDGMSYFRNYSAQPWPGFGVADMHCLKRGERLAEASGAWLKQHADLPEPLRVIADDCQRDRHTGQSFLRGFGLKVDNATFIVDQRPFNAADSPACPQPSTAARAAAIQEQLDSHPMPQPDFNRLMTKLYDVMGVGAAGNWTATRCRVDHESGNLVGGCQAASEFVERFLMQWGGGVEVGWNRVPVAEVPDLLKLHDWYRTVVNSVPKLAATTQASILHNVHAALQSGLPGTTVFAGHDTQLNALIAGLGITWNPHPFPMNSTLPSSAIRFERVGDQLHAEYMYLSNLSDGSGHMSVVPVTFGGIGRSITSMEDFAVRVSKGSVAACATPMAGVLGLGRIDEASPRNDNAVDEVVV